MYRLASIMYLYPGNQVEYERRHAELWPEMSNSLKEYGASNYSIFLDEEKDTLFAYVEVKDKETYESFSNTEICKKWWEYMAPLMKTNVDNSPISKSLRQVFYLE